MSSIYTGQHGEFYVWISGNVVGDAESFDPSVTRPTKGIQHRIDRIGSVTRTGADADAARRQLRSAWERAGWVRQNEEDYPKNGDQYNANGELATTAWTWRQTPRTSIELTGGYLRAGQVRNFSFSSTAETIDTTVLGDTWRDKVPGLKSMTGQAQLMYYRDPDDSDSPVSQMLDLLYYQDSELQRGEFRVMFRLHRSARVTRDQSFPAILTNWSMSCAVGEVVTVDVSFECMGDPYRNAYGI